MWFTLKPEPERNIPNLPLLSVPPTLFLSPLKPNALNEMLYSVSFVKLIGKEPVCSNVTKLFTPSFEPEILAAFSKYEESADTTALELDTQYWLISSWFKKKPILWLPAPKTLKSNSGDSICWSDIISKSPKASLFLA